MDNESKGKSKDDVIPLQLIESDNDEQHSEDEQLRHKLHALSLAQGRGSTRRRWRGKLQRRRNKDDDVDEDGCSVDGDGGDAQRPAGGIRLAVRKRVRARNNNSKNGLINEDNGVQENDFALSDGENDNNDTQDTPAAHGTRSNPGTPVSEAASYLELAPTASLETLATTASHAPSPTGSTSSVNNTGSLPLSHLPVPASSSTMSRSSSAPLALVDSILSSSLLHSPSNIQEQQRDALGGGGPPKRSDTVRSFFLKKADTLRFPGLSHAFVESPTTDAETKGTHLRFHRRKPNYERKARPHLRNKKKCSKGEGSDSETDLILDTLTEAGYAIDDLKVKEEWYTECLYENQRGISMLGVRYGANALFPWDPMKWTRVDRNGNITNSPYDITNHPLPTPAWKWHHSEWLVNMAGDVDSEGFSYSTRFGSRYWRGLPSLRFVVRRRMWIRSRYRAAISPRELTKLSAPSHSTLAHPNVSPRLDRSPFLDRLPSTAFPAGNPLAPILANHLSLTNPFLSWYSNDSSDKPKSDSENGESADQNGTKDYHKEDLIHANFIRVAKVLVRRTTVDRERLACWQYWLGERKELVHSRQMTDSEEHRGEFEEGVDSELRAEKKKQGGKDGGEANTKADRPDLRDVWDLLEDRLDSLLQLFEYQDTRRVFLTLLSEIHDSSHSSHRYLNRSHELHGPAELSPVHEHGGKGEMGGEKTVRVERNAEHGMNGRRGERLEFMTDVRRRLGDINGSQKPEESDPRGVEETSLSLE